MRVTLTGKFKQGGLWEIVERYGSQSAAARVLRVGVTCFGQWVNFRHLPSRDKVMKLHPDLERRLAREGVILEDVFPQAPIKIRFTKIKKTIEVEEELLLDVMRREPSLLTYSMDEEMEASSLVEQINQSLMTELTPREEAVIRARFGIGGEPQKTLDELGKRFDVCRGRIGQIEAKALRKLRRLKVARELRKCL